MSAQQRSHLVAAIVLDPIEDVIAVVPDLRVVLPSTPMIQIKRAVDGAAALYVYDNRRPETTRAAFAAVWRTVRGLGLPGEWLEYEDGKLTGRGRFGAERA